MADDQLAVVPVADHPLDFGFNLFAEKLDDLGVEAAVHAAKGVGGGDQGVRFQGERCCRR